MAPNEVFNEEQFTLWEMDQLANSGAKTLIISGKLNDDLLLRLKSNSKLVNFILRDHYSTITDKGLEAFTHHSLDTLSLEHCKYIKGDGLAYLKNCSNLRVLNLRDTGVDDKVVDVIIHQFPKLEELSLRVCLTSIFTPQVDSGMGLGSGLAVVC
jgi:hypothetical protein